MNRNCEPIRKVDVPKGAPNEWDNNQIYNISRTYERHFARLIARQPKENVELYTRFLKRMKIAGISIVRRLNYIRSLLILKKILKGKLVSEVGKEHIDSFFDEVSHNSSATIQMRFNCLKKFLRFIGKGEVVDGIKTHRKKEIRVRAGDLLTREDIQKLLDATSTKRGRAFILMLYESGARIGEMLNVRLDDLEFDQHGVLASLDGKTGRRRIRLVESAQYLKDWVNEIKLTHPDTPYLWFGIDDRRPSQYATTVKFLRQTSGKAGLRKKISPHLFRHSRASELAQKLREPQLRAFMGWAGSSDMPQVYIHLSAQDMDKAILELYKTENSKLETVVCAQHSASELDEIRDFCRFWRAMKSMSPSQAPCPASP